MPSLLRAAPVLLVHASVGAAKMTNGGLDDRLTALEQSLANLGECAWRFELHCCVVEG